MEWQWELSVWTKKFLLMGKNFSLLKQVGHELEQQRAGNLRNAVRRICAKIECRWFCNPIKGHSNCQLIHKNYTYWGKNLDWCWIRKTFTLRSSVEEIDPSSSSWKPTSRQWRSDWILVNKNHLQNHFLYCHHWSDEKWNSSMAGGRQKKIFQYCSDSSRTILYLRALQGRSGRNSIDPPLQDNVLIPNGFPQLHLSRRMCNQFHHQFRIDTGRTKFEQQIDSILSACGSHGQRHKDPDTIDLEAPRIAQYMHEAWKKHQSMEETSEHGVGRHRPCSEERIELSIERFHSARNTSSLLYPESCSDGNLEKSYTRRSMRHFVLLQRFPWNMTGWKIWVQKLLDKQKEKLLDKQKVPNEPN